jgi:hypothetical protein
MKFLFLVCAGPDTAETSGRLQTATMPTRSIGDAPAERDIEDWVADHDRAGERIFGERLESQTAVQTVRVRDGQLLVTDGPFAESKEYIAGIDVIECASLDDALRIAAEHPQAHGAGIEIRPFWNG